MSIRHAFTSFSSLAGGLVHRGLLIGGLLAALGSASWAAVDVNRASEAELQTVKGIGPALSAKILAARQQSAFKDWNDLVDRVAGLGQRNAVRFSEAGLTVGGQGWAGGTAVAQPAKTRATPAPAVGTPAPAMR